VFMTSLGAGRFTTKKKAPTSSASNSEVHMDSTVLAETEAFIARQREALINQREELLNQQRVLQDQLEQLDEMLTKFDVFEGKQVRGRKQTRSSKGDGGSGRRGSKRDE